MNVEHDEKAARFTVRVEGDDENAELTYLRVGPKLIDIQHTYVPAGGRGHGVAEALATAAFDYARDRGFRVVPTCPFVRKWLRLHPELLALVDPPYVKSLEQRPRA
jgi:predicted GNAT family acetyltransferase